MEAFGLVELRHFLSESVFFTQEEKDQLNVVAEDTLGAAVRRLKRRSPQDYMNFDVFTPNHMWQGLGKRLHLRERAEFLSEWLHAVLKLRLPNENTFGQMTALLVGLEDGVPGSFQLHESLQIVKSTWKLISKKLERDEDRRMDLLSQLPGDFGALPPEIQAEYNGTTVAHVEERLVTSRHLSYVFTRVPLRSSHRLVNQAAQGQPALSAMNSQLQRVENLLRGIPDEEGPLTNLRIFRPGSRSQQQPRAPPLRALGDVGDLPRDMRIVEPTSIADEQERARAAMDLPAHPPQSTSAVPVPGSLLALPPVPPQEEGEEPEEAEGLTPAVEESASKLEEYYKRKAEEQKPKGTKRPRAASKQKPAVAKPKAKSKGAKGKKTAAAKVGGEKEYVNSTFFCKKFGEVKAEYYTQKSYIRAKNKKTGKFEMIIGSCHKRHHKEICRLLIPYVKKDKSLEELRKLREGIERRLEG